MIRVLKHIRVLALSLLAMPALAQESDLVEARILTGWRLPDGTHQAGLEIRLRDGWKTYWRAPGDAGIPPRFNWSGSRNLRAVEVEWPTPREIDQGGMTTIGYEKAVILPLRITPRRDGQSVSLSGEVDMGVCSDVCVPVTLSLDQDLPRSATKPDPRIIAALASRPYSAQEAGVSRVACRISPAKDGLHLRAEIDLPGTGGRELAVIETSDPNIWVAPAKTTRQGGRLVAEVDMYHVDGRSFALDRSGLRITVLGRGSAVDIQGCPAG
ncbi:MAG: protein-disulfide reductase DsbD family protein [Rhodobacteraceae bacterium]|nr:protein-disulfide reductase DsbD family protein [Paracoccaceae bacterium]